MNAVTQINISGFGLCSSLGGFSDACAAFRAGINRYVAHPTMALMNPGDEEPIPLTIAPAASGLLGYQGAGRKIKMLKLAYLDLLSQGLSKIPTEGLHILLAMPDPESRAFEMEYPEEVTRMKRLQDYSSLITGPLFEQTDPTLSQAPMQMVFGDRVAFARLIQKSTEILSQGQAKHCLLIVADSLINDNYLDLLWGQGKLKTADNPVGYIPGEGAAMILLSATDQSLDTAAASVRAIVDNSVIQQYDPENHSPENGEQELQSWQGKKLAAVARLLLGSSDGYTDHPHFISDLNGQENRSMEWGMFQVDLKSQFPDAVMVNEFYPAVGFGEVGTMMGPLAMAISMASVQRNYAQQRSFVILLSEENGKRATIQLRF